MFEVPLGPLETSLKHAKRHRVLTSHVLSVIQALWIFHSLTFLSLGCRGRFVTRVSEQPR